VKIDPRAISADAAYYWMVASIVPRPIAWVSSLNEDGTANLAPFSFFSGVGSDPPTCLFCVGRKTKVEIGNKKDTWANVERTGEYVIHIVPDALAQKMNVTSKEYPHGVDEFALAGVTKAACERVAAPRIVEAPIAMECKLLQINEVGQADGGGGTAIIVGEILYFHVHDEVLEGGRIDPGKVDAVGRMGGALYARTRDRFEMPRPK
jgi:flavin reductase (DIM6/NTAB) family NADH-FMN oxidoreductase RutF